MSSSDSTPSQTTIDYASLASTHGKKIGSSIAMSSLVKAARSLADDVAAGPDPRYRGSLYHNAYALLEKLSQSIWGTSSASRYRYPAWGVALLAASKVEFEEIDAELSVEVLLDAERQRFEQPPPPFVASLLDYEHIALDGLIATADMMAPALHSALVEGDYHDRQRQAIQNNRRFISDSLVGASTFTALQTPTAAVWCNDDRPDDGNRQMLYLLFLVLRYRVSVISRALNPR